MLIISNFKDFYDGMSYLGVDKTIPFKRHGQPNAGLKGTLRWMAQERKFTEQEQQIIDNSDLLRAGRRSVYYPDYMFRGITAQHLEPILGLQPTKSRGVNTVGQMLLGFCGTLYRCLCFSFSDPHDEVTIVAGTEEFEAVTELCFTVNGRPAIDRYLVSRYRSTKPMENTFEHEEIFTAIGKPYFILTSDTVLYDFPLTNTNFPSLIDAQTAWTKLEFFLTNTLRVNERETVDVDNKHKILAAGFDTKTSFRHPVKVKDLYGKK
jgi:hypothetical protein